MSDAFDPYLQWLGIGPHERPVDHYRLLGVERFEVDAERIAAAADERMTFVRSFQTGPRGPWTQKLLNELAAARICLLNPRTKSTYDDFLRGLASVGVPGATPAPAEHSSLLPPSQPSFSTPSSPPPSWHSAPPPLAGSTPTAPLAIPVAVPTVGPVAYYTPPPDYAAPVERLAEPPPPPPPLVERLAGPPAPPLDDARAPLPFAEPAGSDPLVARRWFPLLVLTAVFAVAAGVWIVGRTFRGPPAADESLAGAPPANDAEQPVEPAPEPAPEDDYPAEVVLAQEGNGEVNFPASVARLTGPALVLDTAGAQAAVGGWTGSDDAVAWDFRLVKPDIFRVEVTYAASDDAAGGRYSVRVGDSEKIGEIVSTGGSDKFRTDRLFLSVKRRGRHTLVVSTVQRKGAELWTLQSLKFTPQGVGGK